MGGARFARQRATWPGPAHPPPRAYPSVLTRCCTVCGTTQGGGDSRKASPPASGRLSSLGRLSMDMTGQPRLYLTAVEAAHIQFRWDGPRGWEVHLNWRRQGDGWSDEPAAFYAELSTVELADVIAAELERILGL